MLTLLISTLIPLSLVLVFRLINKPHKPPIFGIYQQKNKFYWFKYVFMYVVLTVRKVSITDIYFPFSRVQSATILSALNKVHQNTTNTL